jgi:hypothetical protein
LYGRDVFMLDRRKKDFVLWAQKNMKIINKKVDEFGKIREFGIITT